MQTLTNDLLDKLAAQFQAAASGYRGRIEVDFVNTEAGGGDLPTLVQSKVITPFGITFAYDDPVTAGSLLIAYHFNRDETGLGPVPEAPAGWAEVPDPSFPFSFQGPPGCDCGHGALWWRVAQSGDGTGPWAKDNSAAVILAEFDVPGTGTLLPISAANAEAGAGVGAASVSLASGTPGVPALIIAGLGMRLSEGNTFTLDAPASQIPDGTTDPVQSGNGGGQGAGLFLWQVSEDGAPVTFSGTMSAVGRDGFYTYGMRIAAFQYFPAEEVITQHFRPSRISIDKSRRLVAGQLDIEVPNEDGALILSPDSVFQTNEVIRCYQWYGDTGNEVLTFTGLLDVIHEGRDIRTVTITARDMMKRLIDQTFSATGPQGADEAGAVRTPANGVYLETEASDIVIDILDRAGWPTDMRDITPTSYMLDEYVIADGSSWADAIINDNGPTGLTGYEAGAREDGTFYFRPLLAAQVADADADPEPVYSYIVADPGGDNLISRNVLRLDHEIDDYDLKTRVKVRGNLATVKAAWTEQWHTNTFPKPVGIWYDAAEPNHIKVLDRSTKKIYRYKTSSPRDRDPSGIWPLNISGDVTYPLGLSGDPADSDRFWVLEAAWRVTGSANLNASIHKYDASSGAHLAEYSIPDGEWTDLKVSASFLWLTNKTTDKIHKRSKTDGSSIASYTTTYNSNAQTNPTGVFVDGTTLGAFFLGHARFLLLDESDPTTVDTTNALGVTSGKISTAGTSIYGGEIDTTTNAHLYACTDDLGLVWKFALTEPSTTDIAVEIVDTDLEDELGSLAQAENREHDTHPGDADHPFEIRRETLTLEKTITNLAQATETANRVLALLAHRRETLDYGVVGHPGHQRGDLHQLTDPVTGVEALYVLDTYRDNMDDRGYLGTVAYVPYEPVY